MVEEDRHVAARVNRLDEILDRVAEATHTPLRPARDRVIAQFDLRPTGTRLLAVEYHGSQHRPAVIAHLDTEGACACHQFSLPDGRSLKVGVRERRVVDLKRERTVEPLGSDGCTRACRRDKLARDYHQPLT